MKKISQILGLATLLAGVAQATSFQPTRSIVEMQITDSETYADDLARFSLDVLNNPKAWDADSKALFCYEGSGFNHAVEALVKSLDKIDANDEMLLSFPRAKEYLAYKYFLKNKAHFSLSDCVAILKADRVDPLVDFFKGLHQAADKIVKGSTASTALILELFDYAASWKP